jgi:streptomycin 6-kinase
MDLTDLERAVVEVHGPRGRAWLDQLPALAAACERRWCLRVGEPFARLSYHWVAPATARDGTSVVLKLGVPNPELTSEIETLRAWAGRGAAQLLDGDADAGVLLLEHLRPGTALAELGAPRDDEATAIALDLMRRLHTIPLPSNAVVNVRSLGSWTDGLLDARLAGFAPELLDRAIGLREELLADPIEPVLLHADLHHANILAAERQPWLVIDPKGVVGDPAYEPSTFLNNPSPARWLLDGALERRVDRFAEVFDRPRLLAWAFVQAVLSAWWSVEDHGGGHEPALAFAELVARLR